jgi:preprotein translocase subunit Sss1
MKQLMAGVGIALVGVVGITALKDYIGELDW